MNRRDLLKMIPGGTAALAFFGLRKANASKDAPKSERSFYVNGTTGQVGIGTITPKAKLHIRTDCHDILIDIDPGSPDGDYMASVTMLKTPEGYVVTEWKDSA